MLYMSLKNHCSYSDFLKSSQSTFTIMASSDAWTLLVKHFGFTYHCGNYYFPSNKKNQTGKVSSTAYFGTLKELQKHLCACGLPQVKKLLNKDEIENLNMWIRYANVISLSDAAKINQRDKEDITWVDAWRMLQKLGLEYNSGYLYPNPSLTKPPLRFDRKIDFVIHLARLGIPCTDEDTLDRDDRLKLDLYIAKIGLDNIDCL